MRTLNLYYIYDNINECAITTIIPAANDLVAAIGFRDTYIKGKDKRPYTAYDLVRFGVVDVDEDGQYHITKLCNIDRIVGRDIMNFISDEYKKLEIDDDFIEENKEE